MLTGSPPFTGTTFEEMLQSMKQTVEFPDHVTSNEKQLICSILRVHPHKRPEVRDMLLHPYFQEA